MRVAAALLLVLAALARPACGAVAIRDDLGRDVRLERPARRVVALAPFLGELVFSAGAGDRLVGVSAYSDYPPEARRLPQVADAAGVSFESIAALHADLVLAWTDSIRRDEIERIASLGVAVYVARARTFDDVPRALRAIGVLLGKDVREPAAQFERRMAALRAANAAKTEVPILLEIWHRPLTTISGRHFMNDALAVCRARNVFADLPGVAPLVPWELVYARDPFAIVGVGSDISPQAFFGQWREHPTLSAVKAGRLVYVAGEHLERPSLRLTDGVAELCGAIDGLRAAR